jgi:excisionase family DNA binding protein
MNVQKRNNEKDPVLLRPKQAAEALCVTTHTLCDWHKLGKLTAYRTPGGQLRIPQSEVDRILGRNASANGATDEQAGN